MRGSSEPVAAPVSSGPPRLTIESAQWQIVALRRGGDLAVYVDDASTNAPAQGLSLQVRSAHSVLRAVEETSGLYSVPAESLNAREPLKLGFVLRQVQAEATLEGILPPQDTRFVVPPGPSHWRFNLMLGAIALLVAWRLRKFRIRKPGRRLPA